MGCWCVWPAGRAAGAPSARVKFCRGRYREGRPRPANFCWERPVSECGVGCLQRRDPREGPSSPCAGRQRAPPRFFAKIAHVFLSGLGATKMRGSAVIGVTEAVARGNWLWRCLRTCAVACRGRLGQCCPEAKRGLMPRLAFVLGTVAAGMALRTPQNAGGGRGDASFVQNTTRTIASGPLSPVIRPRHGCTRRPRANHAYYGGR